VLEFDSPDFESGDFDESAFASEFGSPYFFEKDSAVRC
jgi:hypothetical protein